MTKFRIAGVHIQVVLVLDDGENLSPGPEAEPRTVSLAELVGSPLHDRLVAELAALDPATVMAAPVA